MSDPTHDGEHRLSILYQSDIDRFPRWMCGCGMVIHRFQRGEAGSPWEFPAPEFVQRAHRDHLARTLPPGSDNSHE